MDEKVNQGDLFDSDKNSNGVQDRPDPESESQKEETMMSESAQESSAEVDPANFQEAMDQLQEAAKQLESGELPLEEAMERYREGQELINFCEERLQEAELLVEEIDDSGESPSVQPKEDPSE